MTLAYLDSSAIIKLIVPEAASVELRRAAQGWAWATSALARVEVPRALRRSGHVTAVPTAVRLLAGMQVLAVDDGVLRLAADLDPPGLRSLDAVHLAAALTFGPHLRAVVTYDRRMADAAAALGLAVEAPA